MSHAAVAGCPKHEIITSPVTEIKDFERVPENIVTAGRKQKLAARPCNLGVLQLQAIASVVIITSPVTEIEDFERVPENIVS